MPVIIYDIIPSNFTYDNLMHTLNYHGGKVTLKGRTAFIPSTSNANMWARFKPYKSEYPLTNEDERKKVNCGIGIPEGGNDVITVMNNQADYFYAYPIGTAFEPFRIKDYVGYQPDAVAPCENYRLDFNYKVLGISYGPLYYDINVRNKGDNSITINDLGNLGECYLCVVLLSALDNSLIGWQTAPEKLNYDAGSSVAFTGNTMSIAFAYLPTCKYYLLASRNKYTTFQTNAMDNNNRFYKLPFLTAKERQGIITREQSIVSLVSLMQKGIGISRLGTIEDIHNYIDTKDPGDFYSVNRIYGSVFIEWQIDSLSSRIVTIDLSNVRMKASPTPASSSSSDTTGFIVCGCYTKDTSGKYTVDVTGKGLQIQAMSSVTLLVGVQNFLKCKNGVMISDDLITGDYRIVFDIDFNSPNVDVAKTDLINIRIQ